jgi:hypothetical protein
MGLFLTIQGSQVELDVEDENLPLTFSVADMKQPDKRKSSSSKTGKLPFTANNLNILRNVYNLSGANLDTQILQFTFDPRVRVECRYVTEDGITLFDGLFQVLKTIKEPSGGYFEYLMFSNIQNVIAELGDILVSDLDWSEYSHQLDKFVIRDSWDSSVEVAADKLISTPNYQTVISDFNTRVSLDGGTLEASSCLLNELKPTNTVSNFTSDIPDGFGYVYSWFDLGFAYNGTPRRQKTNQLTLGVYFREVLSKMMAFAGQDYTFTMNDLEMFKRMVLFNEGGEIPKLSQAQLDNKKVDLDNEINFIEPVPSDFISTYQLSVNRDLSSYFTIANIDPSNQVQNGKIIVGQSGLYKLNFSGSYYVSAVASNFDSPTDWQYGTRVVGFAVLRNGIQVAPSADVELATLPTLAATKQETLETINYEGEFFFNNGDVIDVRMYVAYTAIWQDQDVQPQDVITITIESKTDEQNILLTAIEADLEDGSDISIARFLPKLKCADFYKSLMRMFNLYQIDTDDGVEIIPAVDFYLGTNANSTDDWSQLLDYSNTIEIEPPNRIEGKFYSFAFTEEQDLYNKTYREEWGQDYGNRIFEVANTWQQGTNEVKLSFAQSVPVQIAGTDVIMPAIYKEENGVVSPYKGKGARVFFYNGLINVPQPQACSISPSNGDWGFPDLSNEPLFISKGANWCYPQFHHTLNVANPTFDMVFELPRRLYFDIVNLTNSNLWSEYWEKFILELTSADSKILTAYFKLSKLDIKNLNFKRLKNIDGVVYRLNLVSDYMAGDELTVKCELIKVIQGDNVSFTSIPVVDPAINTDPLIIGDDGNGTGTGVISGGITKERYSVRIYG